MVESLDRIHFNAYVPTADRLAVQNRSSTERQPAVGYSQDMYCSPQPAGDSAAQFRPAPCRASNSQGGVDLGAVWIRS